MRPTDIQGFITGMQTRFEAVAKAKATMPDDSVKQLVREAHVALYRDYPVFYDWWLQDGKEVQWFDGSLKEQLKPVCSD